MYQNSFFPPTGPETVPNAFLCSDRSRCIRLNAKLLNGRRRSPLVALAFWVALFTCGLEFSPHAQAESTLPAPSFSLPAGTYTNTSLTMSDSASGATIHYTTNGSTPTTSSTVYKGPIVLNNGGTFTLKAMAVETGSINSPVTTVTYTIHPTLARPRFSPAGGSYTTTQTVTISDVSRGSTFYYTTNGSTPTTSSTRYSAPITVSSDETINAIAVGSGFTNSPVASATYTGLSVANVNLTWNAPTSSPVPVTGYNVYRAVGSSSTFQLLNSSANTETTFDDNTAKNGTSYTYYVESVDASGGLSVPSNHVSVTVP